MNESSIRYPGWRVATACFTMTLFGFGFGFYGHSVYFAELTTREGGAAFAASTVSAAVTVYYLTSALMMAFTSDLMTRLGPRVFAMTGAGMMGVSLFLISRINSVAGLFVAYLAMAPAFAARPALRRRGARCIRTVPPLRSPARLSKRSSRPRTPAGRWPFS